MRAKEYLKSNLIHDSSNHNWNDPTNDPKTSELMERFAKIKIEEYKKTLKQ